MKTRYILTILTAISFLFYSCEENADRTEYPHSTPIIESVEINPSSLVYGEQVTVKAKVSDPETPLSTLAVRMIVNDMLIAEKEIRTKGLSAEVEETIDVAFTSQLPEDAEIEIRLLLTNVEGDVTQKMLEGIKGKRPYYEVLYLVLDNGEVFELKPEATMSDKYKAEDIIIKSNKIKYRIAEKIDAENQIDFSGKVWGLKGGTIQLVDETGDYITTGKEDIQTITSVTFDNYEFSTSLEGVNIVYEDIILKLEDMDNVSLDGESFKKFTAAMDKGTKLTLEGELASLDVVFNVDFFERKSANEAVFLGNPGVWDIYYSATRKIVIVSRTDLAFPETLFFVGWGIGYPTKVSSADIKALYPNKNIVTSNWERRRECILEYIIFRQTETNVYQATVYMPGDHDGYLDVKPFEGLAWENDKKAGDYTFSGEAVISGSDNWNWAGTEKGNYTITINLSAKTVNIQRATLP